MLSDHRGPALLLAALTGLAAFAFQGSRGLYETTEGRYAEAAREMLVRGDFLEPTLAFRPHYTKPPVAYWAVAAGLRVFGTNTWGARLPGAIAFALTVLVVVATGSRLWGREAGILAGLVYASSPFVVAGAASVATDVFLALFVAIAFFAYVRAFTAVTPRRRRAWCRGMWLAFAAAFLTKGPPGVLALAPLAVFHYRSSRRFPLLDPLGVALFLVVGGSWYAAVEMRHPGLLATMARRELLDRNLTAVAERNPEWYAPFTVYLPVLLLGAGAFLWPAFRFVRRRVGASPKVWRRLLVARDRPASLLLLFVLLPLLVFSLSRSRLPFYLLPVYVAVALALGRATEVAFSRPLRRAGWIAAITVLVLVAGKGTAATRETWRDMAALRDAVGAAGADPTPLVSFSRGPLHGLSFYTGRVVREVEPEEAEAFARGLDGPATVLAGRAETAWLLERLPGWGLAGEVRGESGGTRVIRVGPR